jgi:hypothetical protein
VIIMVLENTLMNKNDQGVFGTPEITRGDF